MPTYLKDQMIFVQPFLVTSFSIGKDSGAEPMSRDLDLDLHFGRPSPDVDEADESHSNVAPLASGADSNAALSDVCHAESDEVDEDAWEIESGTESASDHEDQVPGQAPDRASGHHADRGRRKTDLQLAGPKQRSALEHHYVACRMREGKIKARAARMDNEFSTKLEEFSENVNAMSAIMNMELRTTRRKLASGRASEAAGSGMVVFKRSGSDRIGRQYVLGWRSMLRIAFMHSCSFLS